MAGFNRSFKNKICQFRYRKYTKKDRYEKTIKSLNDVLLKIKKQETDLKRQFSVAQKDKGSTFSTNKSFTIKRLEDDHDKLLKFRDDSIKLLTEIKSEYNNFVLDFDYALFDSIRLFNQMTSNFIKIGVLPDCKKNKI